MLRQKIDFKEFPGNFGCKQQFANWLVSWYFLGKYVTPINKCSPRKTMAMDFMRGSGFCKKLSTNTYLKKPTIKIHQNGFFIRLTGQNALLTLRKILCKLYENLSHLLFIYLIKCFDVGHDDHNDVSKCNSENEESLED